MNKGSYFPALLRSQKTVLSFTDIALLWSGPITSAVRVRVNYYVKHGGLLHLCRGLYAKDKNYNRFELATKIYIPSYVSFESVLAKAGIIFQYYGQIFVASYLTRGISVDGQDYSFRKIKNSVLTNPMGIEHKENCSIASLERALLDTMYLNANYHFDNLAPVNWDKTFEILSYYKNKRLEKSIKKLHKAFKAGEN